MALLEAGGTPAASSRRASAASRKRASGSPDPGYRVAELLPRAPRRALDRRQHLQGQGRQRPRPAWRPRSSTSGWRRTGSCTSTRSCCPASRRPTRPRQRRRRARSPTCSSRGQEIVVQVVKDPLKTKGARLSMELTIAGRYMVYAPHGEGVGVSRRLEDASASACAGRPPGSTLGGGGVIVRTAAARRQARGLRTRAEVPAQAARGARSSACRTPPRRTSSSRRPTFGAGRARHLLRALRARRSSTTSSSTSAWSRSSRGPRRSWSSGSSCGSRRSRCSSPTASTRRSRRCSRGASTCRAAAI